MVKKAVSKGVIKDIIIVGVAVLVIWIGLQVVFGAQNPFYVVASGSMIPVLEVNDVLMVQGDCFDLWGFINSKDCIKLSWYTPFEDIKIGDIIVFDRPSDHNRVIVHRVVSIISDNPKEIRTQGDANAGSIPGTDFPITEEEYIGKVAYVLPQVGIIPKLLGPPVNYIIIAIVIGVMVIKQMTKSKNERKSVESKVQDISKVYDIDKIEKDSEYSKHVEKSDFTEDKVEKLTDEKKDKE